MAVTGAPWEAVLLPIALLAALLSLVWWMVRSRARDPKWEFFSNLFRAYGLDEDEEQDGGGPSRGPGVPRSSRPS